MTNQTKNRAGHKATQLAIDLVKSGYTLEEIGIIGAQLQHFTGLAHREKERQEESCQTRT